MNKKLLTKLSDLKKEASESWKQWQVSQEENTVTVWTRRNKVRKDKACMVLSQEGREGQPEGLVRVRQKKKGRKIE